MVREQMLGMPVGGALGTTVTFGLVVVFGGVAFQ